MNIPTHPFVVCNIEGVRVQALVDTGSMKSFIKKDIQDVIDFDCRRVNKSTERCNSITGDSLKIVGKINVNFSGSRHSYSNDFLISSNIEFDCVLGWDFLVNNHVDLRRGMLGGLSSYVLEGPHGKTPVCARVVPNETHLSGVVESSDTVDKMPDCGSEHGGDSYLLFQSRYKAPTEICLTENVVIPARTELVLEGKLVKTTSADVGMITANRARACEPGIHISHIVAHPCGKIVPVRVGILRNPDRTRTWTRTRRKHGLSKNPDSCSDSRLRNPDSTIENPDSKSKILDSMKLDSDNIQNPEYIPIFNCLSETYNRNSQILR